MQFLFAPVWGALSDRVGRKPILIGSLIGDAIFYTLFGLSVHSLAGQFAARILAGIFSSATLSVAQAYAADITPPNLRAMGLGYLGAAFGVGFVFGPALGGLIGHFDIAWPLYVAALFALGNLAYIARYLPEPTRATADTGIGHRSAAGLGGRFGSMASAAHRPHRLPVPADLCRHVRLRQLGRDVHGLLEAALSTTPTPSPSRAAFSPTSAFSSSSSKAARSGLW